MLDDFPQIAEQSTAGHTAGKLMFPFVQARLERPGGEVHELLRPRHGVGHLVADQADAGNITAKGEVRWRRPATVDENRRFRLQPVRVVDRRSWMGKPAHFGQEGTHKQAGRQVAEEAPLPMAERALTAKKIERGSSQRYRVQIDYTTILEDADTHGHVLSALWCRFRRMLGKKYNRERDVMGREKRNAACGLA